MADRSRTLLPSTAILSGRPGLPTYLDNGGTLETAQVMASHESPRTTRLYDRRGDEISLYEVERIVI